MIRFVALVSVVIGFAVMAWVVLGHAESEAAPSAVNQSISMDNFAFQPNPVTITTGTTVIWTNTATPNTTHTTTSDDGTTFDSGFLVHGQSFSVTFNSTGTFNYYCRIHGAPGGIGMSGTIVVSPASPGASLTPEIYLPFIAEPLSLP